MVLLAAGPTRGGDARHLHRHGGVHQLAPQARHLGLGRSRPDGLPPVGRTEATIGDKVTLRYLYDDRVYATHVCAERLPSSTCNAVLHRSWTAILQTAVFGDGSGPFTGPDPASSFPKQELVVRDMWVEPM